MKSGLEDSSSGVMVAQRVLEKKGGAVLTVDQPGVTGAGEQARKRLPGAGDDVISVALEKASPESTESAGAGIRVETGLFCIGVTFG